MKVINSSNVMCVDIDDTLIMWKSPKYAEPRNKLCFTFKGKYVIKYIRENTVEELKRQKESGRYVVVWSDSGADWAEAIVKALEIEDYVDLVMAKPTVYYDDKDSSEWLMRRRHVEEN